MSISPMGSVADKLCGYISTSLVQDTNYEIAKIILKNYDKIPPLSIHEVADLCYASPSAISRFCRFMGFENYKEFRKTLQEEFSLRGNYSRALNHSLDVNLTTALEGFGDKVIANIQSVYQPDNLSLIPRVAESIHYSPRVALFSHHFLWDILHFLQTKLMQTGKYTSLYLGYQEQLDCARLLTKDDTAIICTIGGSYFSRYNEIWNVIENSGCKIVAITQNMSDAHLNSVDYVLSCGTSNMDDTGKYAALLVTEMIVLAYMKQYH